MIVVADEHRCAVSHHDHERAGRCQAPTASITVTTAITGGRGLLRVIPARLISVLAAAAMAVMAIVTVIEAVGA